MFWLIYTSSVLIDIYTGFFLPGSPPFSGTRNPYEYMKQIQEICNNLPDEFLLESEVDSNPLSMPELHA